MHRIFFIVFILIGTVAGMAQEKFTGYYEPYLKLEYDVTKRYSHGFTVDNRTYWYDDEDFRARVKQLDLAHFSSLALNDKNALALGLQYRFEENFGADEEDELRFTEEYTYTTRPKAVEFEHRVRAEQRFTPSSTSHRFRYNFGVSRSFKGAKIDAGEAYLMADLETLLTVANASGPEYEQRVGAGIGWALTDFAELEVVTEYRIADFTRDLGHELFLVTGLNFDL